MIRRKRNTISKFNKTFNMIMESIKLVKKHYLIKEDIDLNYYKKLAEEINDDNFYQYDDIWDYVETIGYEIVRNIFNNPSYGKQYTKMVIDRCKEYEEINDYKLIVKATLYLQLLINPDFITGGPWFNQPLIQEYYPTFIKLYHWIEGNEGYDYDPDKGNYQYCVKIIKQNMFDRYFNDLGYTLIDTLKEYKKLIKKEQFYEEKLTSFKDVFNTIMEDINQGDFKIQRISKEQLEKSIKKNQIVNENPLIKNFNQIEKLFWDSNTEFWVIRDSENNIKGCAGCKWGDFNSYFINEIESYKKGFGKELLKHLLSLNYNIIYLNSNYGDPNEQQLINYYNKPDFGFTQYDVGKTHYFYKNKNLSEDELSEFIDNVFIDLTKNFSN